MRLLGATAYTDFHEAKPLVLIAEETNRTQWWPVARKSKTTIKETRVFENQKKNEASG